jgi:hypothetical protein
MQLVKVISSALESSKRIVKVLRFGKSDVQTAPEVSPYGIDSSPIKDMIALYSTTDEVGKKVIIGYINKKQLSQPGETRFYSTDSRGTEKFYTWLKNDGTYEMGGNAYHAARFEELKNGFDQLKSDVNNHIQKWNEFAAAYTPGSPTTLGTPPTAQESSESNASIDDAKIDKIKTL